MISSAVFSTQGFGRGISLGFRPNGIVMGGKRFPLACGAAGGERPDGENPGGGNAEPGGDAKPGGGNAASAAAGGDLVTLRKALFAMLALRLLSHLSTCSWVMLPL